MGKYLVAWKNVPNDLSSEILKEVINGAQHIENTRLVRMLANLRLFLEFRKNKQSSFVSYVKPVALHSGFAYFHSKQPKLNQQENEIFSFHPPIIPPRNVKINSLHICSLQ